MKFSPTAILLRRQWRDNDSPLLKAFPEILRALIGKLKHLIPTLNGPAVWCTVGVCASRSSNYRISTSWTSWISTSKGIRHTGTKLRRLQTHDHRRQDHALIAISQNKFARRFGG